MRNRRLKNSKHRNYLFEEFPQRLRKHYLFCFRSYQYGYIKLQRIHNYCEKHGFILNPSTINTIQKSFANMITTAFDYGIQEEHSNQNITDITLQLTHVNALPSRSEQGVFLIIELGNLVEDVRYSLISLLGKQIPCYEIMHSRGYNLAEQIRKSHGVTLLDHLAIGLKEFLEQSSINDQLPQSLQLGLLFHFSIKQKELNHAEILSWSKRFNCPDILHQDLISLFQKSIGQYISYYEINIIACIQDSVAALISVAFEYPNTLISLIFHHTFQLSFVEDIDRLRPKTFFQQIRLRALYQTILSFNFQYLHSNKSIKCHALFQTLLTSIDIKVMQQLNVNYFDIFTCDSCLLETIRLLILELCIHEQLLPNELLSNSKLHNHGSMNLKFVCYLLQGKYSKLQPYLNELGFKKLKKLNLIYMEYICHIVIRRSTRILSSLIACLSDRYHVENLTIAMDSYLYSLCPIYQLYMHYDIEQLRKPWMTMFHFVNPTNKAYLGLTAVMGLQKTQKAIINQDDNSIHLYTRTKRRQQRTESNKSFHS